MQGEWPSDFLWSQDVISRLLLKQAGRIPSIYHEHNNILVGIESTINLVRPCTRQWTSPHSCNYTSHSHYNHLRVMTLMTAGTTLSFTISFLLTNPEPPEHCHNHNSLFQLSQYLPKVPYSCTSCISCV
jgi:hypothetical protein